MFQLKRAAISFLIALLFSSAFAFSATAQTAPESKQVSSAQAPTQIVKDFYKALSEQRFRDALMMTNWRAAIEQFTPDEAEDLRRNFAHLSGQAKVEITGEQLSAAAASVFVKGTDPQTGELKVDEVRLRRETGGWIIVFGDAKTEENLKREGKAYFYKLWMENRHQEVSYLLEDISKAEFIYGATNNQFADLAALVKARLLTADVLGTDLGYRFRLTLSPDKKRYSVNAEPLKYGKTGKLSFLLEVAGDGKPVLKSSDTGGAPYAVKN